MKRFYCTVCKHVKRVRQYPANIQNVDATQPQDRIGSCNRHESDYTQSLNIRSVARTKRTA